MNGFKRASRRQAAVVGLAILMGATFSGCHAGPRFLSRKGPEDRAASQGFFDKDRSKFVARKKARPETDEKATSRDGKQVAKNDSASKPQATESARSRASDDPRRIVAAKPQVGMNDLAAPRAGQGSTSTKKPAARGASNEMARTDAARRPVSDLLEDSLFDEPLPNKTPAKGTKSLPAPSASELAEADPFKNVIARKPVAKTTSKIVAPVNFDDLDDPFEDEAAEEVAEDMAERQAVEEQLASHDTSATKTQRKFLPDMQEASATEPSTKTKPARTEIAAAVRPKERSVEAVSPVANRRRQVEETINEWRQDAEDTNASARELAETARTEMPQPRLTAPRLDFDESTEASHSAAPPIKKSQGAVLNGELIIDTAALSAKGTRSSSQDLDRQVAVNKSRSSADNARRLNANAPASVDIVPGASSPQRRSSNQISLQSLTSDSAAASKQGLETAVFESASTASDLGHLPSLDDHAGSSEAAGPRLMPHAAESSEAIPMPPLAGPDWQAPATSSGFFSSWKKVLMVLSCLCSAVLVGLAWRRRMDRETVPAMSSTPAGNGSTHPDQMAQWPRG